MKKFILVIIIVVGVVAGYLLISRESEKQQAASNADQSVSVLSEPARSQAEAHIKTAIKKQFIDATDKSDVEVSIGDFYFDPTQLKVKLGTTVTWTNDGMLSHDVKSADSSPEAGLNSKLLGRGESYSFKFDKPGLYLYICSPHPTQMRAVIEVVE